MSEDHPLESFPRDDSARVGRVPVFAYRLSLVDYIKSGEEWQTAATDMFARLSARDIQSRTGQPLCDAAHPHRKLANRRDDIGLMMDTWPDTLLRFARHSTDLSVRAFDSLAA
jgi:hypothetical protein